MANQVGAYLAEGTAVAIDRDKNSQHAVRWAIENLSFKEKTIILVHVVSTHQNLHPQDGETRVSTHTELKQLFLPYRGFCARKGIQAKEVILHDLDIASALSEFISASSIKTIVLGASSRSVIARAFKNADVPTSLGKSAPDSCTVYAVSKGRSLKIKSAREHVMETSYKGYSSFSPDNSAGTLGSHRSELSSLDGSTTHPIQSLEYSRSTSISPTANGSRNRELHFQHAFRTERHSGSNTPSPPNSVSSNEHVQQHRFPWEKQSRNATPNASLDTTPFSSNPNSPDHSKATRNFALQQSSIHMNLRGRALESLPQFSMDSINHSEERSFQSDLSFDILDHPTISDSSRSSTSSTVELEDELRRVKLELKQVLEKYNVACQETETARDKVRDIVLWENEKTGKLVEAKHGQEAALAVVEIEKQKCNAAVEISHRAQRIAELESEKRKRAEKKFKHESGEKQKVIEALARSAIRYRRYSIEELEVATNYFSSSEKIGEGGYGPVYKGTIDHTPVAIKVLKSEMSEGLKQFQREVEVLSRMRHPNMVILLGACPEYGTLVYEHMENGSLEDRLFRLDGTPPLSWSHRFRIAAEIATALNFLHGTRPEPLVHRDLKPGNILLDRNYVSKISDVGLCRLVPAPVANAITQYHMTAAAGTFCYIDPEYQQTGMLGTKSDVYSFGVLLLQILTARPPMGLTYVVGNAIEQGRFTEVLDPTVEDWPEEEAISFAKLALRCCELRKRDRPDLDSVVLPELERLRDVGYQVNPPARYYDMYSSLQGHSYQESTTSSQDMGTSYETESENLSKYTSGSGGGSTITSTMHS